MGLLLSGSTLPAKMRINRAFSIVLVGLLTMGISGCGTVKILAAKSLMDDVERATLNSADPQLVVAAMPTLLLLLETFLNEHPTNRDLLFKATKAYTSYGTLIHYQDPQRAKKQFNRARLLGKSAFNSNPQVRKLLDAPYPEFISVSDHLNTSDGPLVFWLASSWGSWINTNTGSLAALADLPKVIYLMEWVLEWDETYESGAPHLFLGAYYAALPPMLGGNPQKSLHHFNSSQTINKGKSLLVATMKAQYLARQTFDKTLHDSLLTSVLNTPKTVGASPLTLQNQLARNIAKQLLAESDAFFD